MNKDINFEYIEEFVDYIISKVENDEDLFVAVVGKFDSIKQVLKEVMTYEFIDFNNIEIKSADIDGYDCEFILSLWIADGILRFGCEKIIRDGEYIFPCGDETYLMEDCSSKIIPLCEGSDLYFVNIDEECDCDEGCDKCCLCDCHKDDICLEYDESDEEKLHGFSATKIGDNGSYSCSFYTSESLDIDEIHSMLKKFGF